MSPSNWWPTPARPSTWFSAEELEMSRRYNRPLARAALARLTGRLLLLAVVHLLVAGLSTEWSTTAVLLMASPLCALAWWLPTTAVDVWFEYRHEPRFGHTPLPVNRFVMGSVASLVPAIVVLALGSAVVYWLMGLTEWWWLMASAGAVVAVGVVARIDRNFRSLGENLRPVEADEGVRFGQLAVQMGVPNVAFAVMETDAIKGLNAFATRLSGQPHVVVTGDLLAADPELSAHVVAHELAHLRRRHLTTTVVVSATTAGLLVAALGPLVRFDVPFRWLTVEGRDPRSVVVMVGLVLVMSGMVSPLLAWLGRAHERQADATAFSVAGGLPLPLVRALHVSHRADLDPGRLARLVTAHPPPAERLHRASRESSHRVPSEG